MNVVYVGPFDSVFVPDINPPGGAVVKHGETVTVGDELGRALLDQPENWAKPGTKAATLSKHDGDSERDAAEDAASEG